MHSSSAPLFVASPPFVSPSLGSPTAPAREEQRWNFKMIVADSISPATSPRLVLSQHRRSHTSLFMHEYTSSILNHMFNVCCPHRLNPGGWDGNLIALMMMTRSCLSSKTNLSSAADGLPPVCLRRETFTGRRLFKSD